MAYDTKEKRQAYQARWYAKHGGTRYQLKYRTKVKTEVLIHYGNGKCQCVMCGESRLACLSIDHINGGGNQIRKGHGRGGTALYISLRREGFPKGYQTLCMNCQFCKVVLDNAHRKKRLECDE